MASHTDTPKNHIENLRKTRFSIGGNENPLACMLDKAVEYLSAELYAKDVHFLMELIQNAEDNVYPEGVDPSLEFVITSRDITATGAPATLLIFNNEKGFTAKNIESICSVGNSTKKGNRKRGYIGEKGIGFKSVFLISAQPYIFSNGYQIRFNEKPCPDCKLGYIVPEWVEDIPSLSDIKQIYGSSSSVPTTTLILPLKPDKMNAVKQQLSSIHPEVLLFLSKIKRLSVREGNEDARLNTVNAIAITKETNFKTRKNIDAESYTLYLSTADNGDSLGGECSYYMWKQKFAVKQENKVEKRTEVEDWVVTLAFPNENRLQRGTRSPGVYAFLPTEIVTNFPFIIQADFILASSRETILLDNPWNQGILDCVPHAFVNALISLVKNIENAPVSSLPRMFEFLPVNSSPYPKLNAVRESIKAKLAAEDIIPSESYTEQKFFYKPSEVGRLMPDFWNLLMKARKQGVSLLNLSSHGYYILNSSFDKLEYDQILNFLGVKAVNYEWYAKCIQGSNLVMGVSEETYLDLLIFLADNWQLKFQNSEMIKISLIKYVSASGSVCLGSISESANGKYIMSLAENVTYASWLIDWSREFRCVANYFFIPQTTQLAIRSCSKGQAVRDWLVDHVKVTDCNVYKYATILNNHVRAEPKLSIVYAYFLQNSIFCKHLSELDVTKLCRIMPLVDRYGHVKTNWTAVLVPANGSHWIKLIGSNPWRNDGYVELGEDYSRRGFYAGQTTTENQLIKFLKEYLGAADIPHIMPPNAGISTVSAPLTKQNAFLLLKWIRNMKYIGVGIPEKFLTCVKEGSWLKITMNGSPGYKPPSQSFLLTSNSGNSSWGNIMQHGSVFVDIPLIDQCYYGDEIYNYKEELKTIGVMFEFGEACEFIGERLMSLAASSTLTRSHVISMLNFIRFLREKFLSPERFICSVKKGRWLMTSCGNRSPVGSVLYNQEWENAKLLSDIPFIDQEFYGNEILTFKAELELLGVIVGLQGNYKLIVDYLKSPSAFNFLTAEALYLVLNCMKLHSDSACKIVNACKGTQCLKTNLGYKSPSDCFLLDPEWGHLLEVFGGSNVIDQNFYGRNIITYKKELKQLGVKIEFEEAVEVFVLTFKKQASFSSITKNNVFSFLSSYRQLNGSSHKLPSELKKCIHEEKWLKTRLGDYRSLKDCILLNPDWKSISAITLLPFIDDGDSCYGKDIHEYKKELKCLGVVVDCKDGLEFVVDGLCFPQDPNRITRESVVSLLEFIRLYLKANSTLPELFLKKASRKWLKINTGYVAPEMCCLFDSNWLLKQTDGPFIDDGFYGQNITSYKKELGAIGVIIDMEKGCCLLATHLNSHSEFATILRIYEFLIKHKWEPENKEAGVIWIPSGNEDGNWSDSGLCVLHDKDNLFGSELNVLDKHYSSKFLNFFSSKFGVKSNPSADDYCKLWKTWEDTGHKLTYAECCAFWGWAMKQKSSKLEKILANDIAKLPVISGSAKISLCDKRDVFIADDLQLKDLFNKSSSCPIFVWYPQPSAPSVAQGMLLDLYRRIGVRTISESVQIEKLSLEDGVELKQANGNDNFIGKELVRVILGFLADPALNMEAKTRHEAVNGLIHLTVLETKMPIHVSYTLSLSSGEIVNAKASRMLRWDKENCKLFTQKLQRAGGQKNLIEYATNVSEVIAEGVLWEKEDQISGLSELIKLAFVLNFDEEAVEFLMKSKNLQVFMEDEEFLSAAFPSG
ncbi:uncharacterized protein LOC126673391 [Mercurialis annua]|uniref:uncharacterized protein LOC126673391 n=1 Tax=Mercurialis annua TaxID=3986 RepID=UPI0024AD97CB|nr:uncharacterized protein LOC126673391 [Mercurialis annua]